jgi:hypothetical protein
MIVQEHMDANSLYIEEYYVARYEHVFFIACPVFQHPIGQISCQHIASQVPNNLHELK